MYPHHPSQLQMLGSLQGQGKKEGESEKIQSAFRKWTFLLNTLAGKNMLIK